MMNTSVPPDTPLLACRLRYPIGDMVALQDPSDALVYLDFEDPEGQLQRSSRWGRERCRWVLRAEAGHARVESNSSAAPLPQPLFADGFGPSKRVIARATSL